MADSKENYKFDRGVQGFRKLITGNLSYINPLPAINDQDIISPYNIKKISSRQVTRIKKNIN